MASKDDEIRTVVSRLDALLGRLRGNVAALEAILARPAPGGGEDDERLAAP